LVDLRYDAGPDAASVSYLPAAVQLLRKGEWEDEFLLGRILFLVTFGNKIDLPELIEKNELADVIVEKLASHAKVTSPGGRPNANPMQGMALAETLKVMFNLTTYCPNYLSYFTPAIPPVAALLQAGSISRADPMGQSVRDLVNALLNLDLGAKDIGESLFPTAAPSKFCEKVVEILDRSMIHYGDAELEQTVTPLVGVLLKLTEAAPDASKEFLKSALLPSNADREQVLGQAPTLPSRLLKNSTNAMTPKLRDTILQLMFELSDSDASNLVENIGYGFASGFLMQRGIPVPTSASREFAATDAAGDRRIVNPLTGQFVDRESASNEPEMTEEEKEREAERLFVLFERYAHLTG